MQVKAYGTKSATSPLEPMQIERRDLRGNDVKIEILYCGICHSDLHSARNDWKGSAYPLVPGHEIVGRVTEVGNQVKGFKLGDTVAVGCMVDSCQVCSACKQNMEEYCEEDATFTYNSPDAVLGGRTFGGYSSHIVVREEFVLKVPSSLDIKKVAPLVCAGITTYTPLRHWKVQKGSKVAVIGLGGLGHMAVKLAVAMGAEVTVITTSASKAKAAKDLGAYQTLVSTDPESMKKFRNYFNLTIDTIPVAHDLSPYIPLLHVDGTHVIVGAIDQMPGFHSGLLIDGRKSIAASLIGGIKPTQELLDFCGVHKIHPEVEMIKVAEINEAYERLLKGDVHYRFVIDMATL